MKVFISGPMTGLPEFNFPAFNECARILKEFGLAVHNPAEASESFGTDKAHEFYMRMAIEGLVTCDAMVQLPGWLGSKGAKIEALVAKSMGVKAYQWQGYVLGPEADPKGDRVEVCQIRHKTMGPFSAVDDDDEPTPRLGREAEIEYREAPKPWRRKL